MSLLNETIAFIEEKAPHENEYLQAVKEVCEYIVPIVNANKDYKSNNVLQRILIPQHVFQFAVEWEDDNGECKINQAWRVQHSNLLGPYKGGTRFHPTLNLSVLKFLAFEQAFKNALTGLSLGAGKGGADFNPKGKSENEIRRFCNAYMRGVQEHIGAYTDVPAGDINVSSKELGFMYGQYLRSTKQFTGALSGKPLVLGGSEMRTQATGFGLIYLLESVLKQHDERLDSARVVISGAGNVALHAALKAIQKNAKVITLSNSRGTLVNDKGFSEEDINWLLDNRDHNNVLLAFSKERVGDYRKDEKPWQHKADIALPCATQNEIDNDSAKQISKNISLALVEGANMPCTDKAVNTLLSSSLIYVPGKVANAGGVILSGFEMQQNAALMSESKEALDKRLQEKMQQIHAVCANESKNLGHTNIHYLHGANVAAFRKLADAMVAAGY